MKLINYWNSVIQKAYLPLRFKFVILFFILITIPFAVSGFITYNKYSEDVEHTSREFTQQLVDQIRFNLDRYFKEMERLTLAPLYSSEILSILKVHNLPYKGDNYQLIDEQIKMNLFISSMSFDRSEIDSILLFAYDGSLFSNRDTSVSSNWRKEGNRWMESVTADKGMVIIAPHDADYYTVESERVIAIARMIREPYTNVPIGYIKIDLPASQFQKIFSEISFSPNSILTITNAEGKKMYPDQEKNAIKVKNPANQNLESPVFVTATARSDYTEMSITAQIPLEDLHKNAKKLISFTVVISLISLTFAFLMAIVSSNRLVRPIRHLQSKMRLVQRGSLNERAKVTTHDEIGQLTLAFNGMIGELERLVKEVYETKLRERDAALSALQSQINPHFMYNTLETFNMLAIRNSQFELSGLVISLGKLLRYTVDHHERLVRFGDELSFCEAYLQIQSHRLGNLLQTEFHVDASLYHAKVPKLFLQPFIENVIEHGIGEMPVMLRVEASLQQDDLIIRIMDNGRGMNPAQVLQLQFKLDQLSPNPFEPKESSYQAVRHGYALRNVHQRLRLMYGQEYGLTIETLVQGAGFLLRLPFHWEEICDV